MDNTVLLADSSYLGSHGWGFSTVVVDASLDLNQIISSEIPGPRYQEPGSRAAKEKFQKRVRRGCVDSPSLKNTPVRSLWADFRQSQAYIGLSNRSKGHAEEWGPKSRGRRTRDANQMRCTLTCQVRIRRCNLRIPFQKLRTNVELCLTGWKAKFLGTRCSIECAQWSHNYTVLEVYRVSRSIRCTWLHESRVNHN